MGNVILVTGLTMLMCGIVGMILLVLAQIAYVKAFKKIYKESERD